MERKDNNVGKTKKEALGGDQMLLALSQILTKKTISQLYIDIRKKSIRRG